MYYSRIYDDEFFILDDDSYLTASNWSYYFIVCTFTTTGYGDINAYSNEFLMNFAAANLMAGVLIFSFFSGKIRKVIESKDVI